MSSKRRILLVEPDPALSRTLADHLTAAGHEVVCTAAGGEDPIALAQGHHLVVLDDSALDSARLCRELKQAVAERPVIVLGNGNFFAADEVVAKPLRLGGLLARIADLLARTPVVTMIGEWRFDPVARILDGTDGDKVRLTDKEAAILSLLLADGGVVSRDRLLSEIWGYGAAITTHTLETHIYRLRRKIERTPAAAKLLVTAPGGYRLAL